jgi:hypothetical protein
MIEILEDGAAALAKLFGKTSKELGYPPELYELFSEQIARVFETSEMRDRNLAVLLLLDISESTKEFLKNTTTTVLSMERGAERT